MTDKYVIIIENVVYLSIYEKIDERRANEGRAASAYTKVE